MPEITEKYIRVPVWRAYDSITATIDISKDKGIKALLGKKGNVTKVATYLFLRSKGWTMSKAKAWIKAHTRKNINNNYMGKKAERFEFSMPIVKCYEEKNEDGESKRFIEGIASNTSKDLHGDRMSPDAIKSMAKGITKLRKKDGTLNVDHSKSWRDDIGSLINLDVNKKNELVMKAELNESSVASDLWMFLTKKKKKMGLSVGGFVKSFRIEVDEKTKNLMRVFEEVVLDHIAVTTSPANPKTWVSAIAKSINGAQVGAFNNSNYNKLNEETMEKDKKTVESDVQDLDVEKNESLESADSKVEKKSESDSKDVEDVTNKKKKKKKVCKTSTQEKTDVDEKQSFVKQEDFDSFKKEIMEKMDSIVKSFEKKDEVKDFKKEEKKEVEKKEIAKEEDKKVEKTEKKEGVKLEKEFVEKQTELIEKQTKQIEELSKTVDVLKKGQSFRKGVELDKFEKEGKEKSLEEALKEVEKKYSKNPDQLFIEKGKIRKEYSEQS